MTRLRLSPGREKIPRIWRTICVEITFCLPVRTTIERENFQNFPGNKNCSRHIVVPTRPQNPIRVRRVIFLMRINYEHSCGLRAAHRNAERRPLKNSSLGNRVLETL